MDQVRHETAPAYGGPREGPRDVSHDRPADLIEWRKVYRGTLTSCLVHPREIFQVAIQCNAAGIILFHNHPSGNPDPSREDRDMTRRLASSGELLGIKVLDHLIIAPGCYFSFCDNGLMV